MTQQSLFAPGPGGIEQPAQAKLLARRDDPETSKAAAAKLAAVLPECQERALAVIRLYGPGTLRQIAHRGVENDTSKGDATALYHELARRCGELAGAGLVDYQRDETGRAVKVDGSRVWGTIEKEG